MLWKSARCVHVRVCAWKLDVVHWQYSNKINNKDLLLTVEGHPGDDTKTQRHPYMKRSLRISEYRLMRVKTIGTCAHGPGLASLKVDNDTVCSRMQQEVVTQHQR